MKTSETLSSGYPSDHLSSTTGPMKPLIESPSVDASLLIETVSGKLVYPLAPAADQICVEDIAWALSRIPRFAGHTITEVPYNVAQHCIYVSELVELCLEDLSMLDCSGRREELEKEVFWCHERGKVETIIKGQFHDGHEAYEGDIPSPIKKLPELQPVFKRIENALDLAIFSHLKFPPMREAQHALIKYCDKLAQAIEAYQFMPSRGINWHLPKPTLVLLQKFPAPMTPLESYKAFLERYEYLKSEDYR
jgi:uncharacterized protein